MAAAISTPIRRTGTILYTNLTRFLAPGEEPDTEFLYMILDRVSSLGSQVFIHKNDIITGNYEDFVPEVEVEFLPVAVSDEEFNKNLPKGIQSANGAAKMC